MAGHQGIPSRELFFKFASRLSITRGDDTINEVRNRLLSQKCFLTKLIKLKRRTIKETAKTVKEEIAVQSSLVSSKHSLLETLLAQIDKRSSNHLPRVLRKGTCSFRGYLSSNVMTSNGCSNPSLPFTRHCKDHILYNVDQLLFSRCSAKDPLSMTQCSRATFDIERKEPLCLQHALGGQTEEINDKAIGQRKRSKAGMALLRPQKRKKKTRIKVANHDSNENSLKPAQVNCHMKNIPEMASQYEAPTHDDIVDVVFNPGDEALVASLVDDLPPLDAASTSLDNDLNEVLDKIQTEEEFNDLFQEPVSSMRSPLVQTSVLQSFSPTVVDGHSRVNRIQTQHNKPSNASYAFMQHDNHRQVNDVHSTQGTPVRSSSLQINGHYSPHTISQEQQLNQLLASLPASNQYQVRPNQVNESNCLTNGHQLGDDLTGLATNILDFLTTEQQQQLNGLIDGALASGTLMSSPTNKLDVVSFNRFDCPQRHHQPSSFTPQIDMFRQPIMQCNTNSLPSFSRIQESISSKTFLNSSVNSSNSRFAVSQPNSSSVMKTPSGLSSGGIVTKKTGEKA